MFVKVTAYLRYTCIRVDADANMQSWLYVSSGPKVSILESEK